VVAWWYPGPDNAVRGVFVRDQARAVARDTDVTVLAFEPARDLGRAPFAISDGEEDGLRTVRIRHAPLPGLAAAAAYLPGAAAAALRLVGTGPRPDVVHAHVYMAGLIASPLARAWRAPLVLSEHYSGFQLGTLGTAGRAAARAAMAAADTICPPSESLRRALEPLAPRGRFRVVPNPVDTDRFRPPVAREPGERLLFVGNLEEVKGVATLLEAAAILRTRRPGITLDLIGGGDRRREFEALADGLGLGGAARFRGPLERGEVAEAMRAADVLLAPSRTETFGLAVAEALASGLPVVAARAGALSELVGPADGALVPAGDPGALADAAGRMLDGAAGRDPAAMARAARDRFSPGAVADAWSAVYDEATARSRRGT